MQKVEQLFSSYLLDKRVRKVGKKRSEIGSLSIKWFSGGNGLLRRGEKSVIFDQIERKGNLDFSGKRSFFLWRMRRRSGGAKEGGRVK